MPLRSWCFLPLLASLYCAHALQAASMCRARAPSRAAILKLQTAAVDDASIAKVTATLLDQVNQTQRSLAAIDASVAALEAAPPPKKLKSALQGDWKLTYASDEAAVEPFMTGIADGPFNVLEEVYLRLMTGDILQSIEVVRKIGPFGNTGIALNGKWSVSGGSGGSSSSGGGGGGKGGGGKKGKKGKGGGGGMAQAVQEAQEAEAAPAAVSWRSSYMIDARGREVSPPPGATASRNAAPTHVSPELLVLRFGAGSASYAVWTKMKKGELKKALESEYQVFAAEALVLES